MSKSLLVLTACSQIAIGAAVTATRASAQSSTVVFQGLTHTAVGSATLRLDAERDALEVNTLDLAGEDGVAVTLKEATSWTARLGTTGSSALPLRLSWSALADGRRISTASMRQDGGGFEVSALFTGATRSTYSAYVYDQGRLVGALGSLPPTAHIVVPISFCQAFSDILECRFTSTFHNSPNSECEWRFAWGQTVVLQLPNGVKVAGNELRLVEEVRPASHYPYLSFDRIVMQGNAPSFAFFSETVR
jgi:hypothetical protein